MHNYPVNCIETCRCTTLAQSELEDHVLAVLQEVSSGDIEKLVVTNIDTSGSACVCVLANVKKYWSQRQESVMTAALMGCRPAFAKVCFPWAPSLSN